MLVWREGHDPVQVTVDTHYIFVIAVCVWTYLSPCCAPEQVREAQKGIGWSWMKNFRDQLGYLTRKNYFKETFPCPSVDAVDEY